MKALVEEWRTQAEHGERIDASWVSAVRGCANELAAALTEPTDAPIADPAERARAVAKELRRRGIFACVQGGGVTVCAEDKAFWYHLLWEKIATMGPRAIADEIQREEAQRAKKWAGDE